MKKVLALLLLLAALISIAGCNNNATYTDDAAIAKKTDSFSTKMWTSNTRGNEFTASATLTGARTIWRYNAESDIDVTFAFLLSVTGDVGKAKLVLIGPDDDVTIITENANSATYDELQYQTISLKKGSNRIKVVAQDAPKFELTLSTDIGQLGI